MRSIGLNYTQSHRTHGAFVTHFSNFCKKKIDDDWLTEREETEIIVDPYCHNSK